MTHVCIMCHQDWQEEKALYGSQLYYKGNGNDGFKGLLHADKGLNKFDAWLKANNYKKILNYDLALLWTGLVNQ